VLVKRKRCDKLKSKIKPNSYVKKN